MKPTKFIKIPILNNEYKVIVSWGDTKRIRKEMSSYGYPEKELYDESDLDFAEGLTFRPHTCAPFIVLPGKPQTPAEIGTLAHEAVHAVCHIMREIGEDSAAEEIVCHSVGAIVRNTLEQKL